MLKKGRLGQGQVVEELKFPLGLVIWRSLLILEIVVLVVLCVGETYTVFP